MQTHILSERWHIRPLTAFQQGTYAPDTTDWLPVSVPSHWQQTPELADYTGRVVYRCLFRTPPPAPALPPAQQRTWLRLNGVFYWAQPYLNGADLGRHEGYFDPYEQEITGLLHPNTTDDNTLFIEVECPEEHNKVGKRLITGVFSHWDCLDPQANPGGIWLPVEIHQSGPVRLQSVRCHTEHCNQRVAQLRYTIDLDAAAPGSVVLRWTLAPRTFDGDVQTVTQRRTLRGGPQTLGGMFKLSDPRLWWTHDLGNPDLYTITLDVLHTSDGNETVSDSTSFAFGVRRFELRNWIPHLNGVRFLAKGTNYAPGDMRIATMTPERYEQDMRLARECHMNLIRTHAHVEHPAFYDAANAAGLLVWQDMPLQWLYHARVLPEARRQAKAMVHLLYNHPCVAIWCMHNEPIFVADTNDETRLTRWRTYQSVFGFSWNRDVMDTQLRRIVRREDPGRPAIRSSGEFRYIPVVRPGTDAHLYFGWYSAYGTLEAAEQLRQYAPGNLRFVTEFGAQSFPNVESCHRFMPADITQIDFDHLARRHGFQPDIMSKWIPWRESQSLEELVERTQEYQVEVNRFYIDRLRYHKYRPTGGIVPFMFCDSFPAVLWSVLDYWRVPKRSYYAMQVAFSPYYAFTLCVPRTYRIAEPVELPIYVVNDAQEAVDDAHLTAHLRAPDGTTLAAVEHTLTLEADCLAQEVDRLRLTPSVAGVYSLDITLGGVEPAVEHTYRLRVAQ